LRERERRNIEREVDKKKKRREKLSSGKQNRRLLYQVAEKVTFEHKINEKYPDPTCAYSKLAIFQC
jgi:hypothetical protein